MRKSLYGLVFAIALFVSLQTMGGIASAANPVLFFSDLTWGPKTGWEGSSTKGAAVTVWGKNFGTNRGNSYITVNGASFTNASDYAEWGVIGPARELERITFWLNSGCQDGAGTITVTINGATSNSLPFTITNGTIYFVSPTGNNSNNGRYATSGTGGNGPFQDIYMFNPGLDSYSLGHNPSGDGQYIVYVRAGTYTNLDTDGAFVALRGPYGGSDRRKALIAYPGETPTLNASNAQRGVIWNATYSPYGRNSYFTYSKLYVVGAAGQGTDAIGLWGDYNRVIGNHFKDLLAGTWSGVVMVDNSRYSEINGNYFDHLGFDSYKHNIYIKTHPNYVSGDTSCEYTYVGWNEFNNAYANDAHGGVIFISKASDATGKYTRYIYIHDNYFHDGNMEFIYTGDNTPLSDIYIYNNIFRHGASIGGAGIFLAWHTNSVYLYNNLFYQMGGNGYAMIDITGNTTAVFRNNIWVPRSGQTMLNIETYQGATFNSDHDLFFGTPPSGAGITVTNARTGDPRFVNAAAYDFHLTANSPAIDAGTSTPPINSIVTRDYDGIPRPLASAYDIGPYEGAGGGGGADATPPSAVSNLSVSNTTSNSVTLTWSATGDDGMTGTAAAYDIRYSTSPINGSNWASATQVGGEPAPQAPGTTQPMTINGLLASTTYYFAMTVSDEVPNTSQMSNVASATTQSSTGDTTPPAAPRNLRILP